MENPRSSMDPQAPRKILAPKCHPRPEIRTSEAPPPPLGRSRDRRYRRAGAPNCPGSSRRAAAAPISTTSMTFGACEGPVLELVMELGPDRGVHALAAEAFLRGALRIKALGQGRRQTSKLKAPRSSTKIHIETYM